MYGMDQKPELFCQLPAYCLDSVRQLAALTRINQRNEPEANFQAQYIGRLYIVPA